MPAEQEGETVLLEVFCACSSSHDVWGKELNGAYDIEREDLRCPACLRIMPTGIEPRESLA